MPSYKYRVIFEDGKVGHGKIMALNKSHAMESLKRDKIQPIAIKKLPEKRTKYKRLDYNKLEKQKLNRNVNIAKPKQKIDITKITLEELKQMKLHPFSRITTKDIIVFVNNLYILKKAKFNNIQALRIIYDQIENPRFKDIVEDIIIGVESGEKMNVIMQNYPTVFPPMFINFVKVGEDSGNLDTALLYARDYLESSNKLKKQVRAAVIPKVLQFIFIIGIMFALVIIGVPIIQDVYDMFDSTSQIPRATLVTLDVANWLMAHWYVPTGILVAIISIFLFVINTPKGRYKWDKFKLTCPVVGPLLNNITIHKFFQAMLLNLKNGMRIQESLEVSKNVTSNYYFLSVIEIAKVNAVAGESWLEPFEENKIFKPMVSQMVEVGMQTELSTMMDKVNEYIQMEIDESLERFQKILPEVTYSFVGAALILFTIVILVPLVIVYMGGFIDMP